MMLYDATMLAIAHSQGVRRPTMPEGVVIVPLMGRSCDGESGHPMKAFLVSPRAGSRCPDWSAGVDDLVAVDWEMADWRKEFIRQLTGCG